MSQQKNPGAGEAALGAGVTSPARVDISTNTSPVTQIKQPRCLSKSDPRQTAKIIRQIRPDLTFHRRKFWKNGTEIVPKSEIYRRLWRFLKRALDTNGNPFRPQQADFEAVYDALREELSDGTWQRRRT